MGKALAKQMNVIIISISKYADYVDKYPTAIRSIIIIIVL